MKGFAMWILQLALAVPVIVLAERGHVYPLYVWTSIVFWQWACEILALRPGCESVRDLRRELLEERSTRRRMRLVIDRAHALVNELAPDDVRVRQWVSDATSNSAPPLPHIRDRRG
jgi:hypothetical protein